MAATVVLEDLVFLNLTQACRLVHLGKPTLRAAIDAGDLRTAPCRTKSIRIARAELERWAASKVASAFPSGSGGAVGPLVPASPSPVASGDHSKQDGAT